MVVIPILQTRKQSSRERRVRGLGSKRGVIWLPSRPPPLEQEKCHRASVRLPHRPLRTEGGALRYPAPAWFTRSVFNIYKIGLGCKQHKIQIQWLPQTIKKVFFLI